MAIPLKLGSIEQQHLQELYDAAGVPRDDLPYSDALAQVCKDFQDRTFKNASEPQVYGAMLKYVRSGRCPKVRTVRGAEPADRVEQARLLTAQRAFGRKLQPYTRDFDSARNAFARGGGADLSPHEFWRVVQLAGSRPVTPRTAVGSTPPRNQPKPARPSSTPSHNSSVPKQYSFKNVR